MNKSIENLLISNHGVVTSRRSMRIATPKSDDDSKDDEVDGMLVSSPKLKCPKREFWKLESSFSHKEMTMDDQLLLHSSQANLNNLQETTNPSLESTKLTWYNALYPTYKSRSNDFKKIFSDLPDDERLLVDYSCSLQRKVLVHGRLYVSQNYICFYSNEFMWKTSVSIHWVDVAAITKEKSSLVIPNAILISTDNENFFFSAFGARDQAYSMLFLIWQNTLVDEPMSNEELWQFVHSCYGDELGMTSEDEDYVSPFAIRKGEKKTLMNSCSTVETEKIRHLEALPRQWTSKADLNQDPTDMSDNTESDMEKYSVGFSAPEIPVCTSSHEGRQLAKITLPIHIDKLFTLLFTSSKFFLDFHQARKTTNLFQSPWSKNIGDSGKTRTVSLTAFLTQVVGPKTSQVSETQIILPCSVPGLKYCIDIETLNSGIPYADSFSVETHFCMTYVSDVETNLQIYSQVKFKKHVWAMMKSLIQKSCWNGLEEYFWSLTKAVAEECEKINKLNGCESKSIKKKKSVKEISEKTSTNSCFGVVKKLQEISGFQGISQEPVTMMSWILLIAVLCLMIINGLLYYKLWGLEDAAAYTVLDLHVLRNTPKSEEDWINLLQQQESLHNIEMRKWQRVLHTAAQLLKQTEESLTELRKSMHPTATEKMFSVLKPNL